MGEGLREVPGSRAPPGRTPRRADPHRSRRRAAARTAPVPRRPPMQRRARRRARRSTAGTRPRRREPVDAFSRRAVAHDEAVARQSRWIASTVPTTRGSSAGRKPTSGISRATRRARPSRSLRERVSSALKPSRQTSSWISSPERAPAVDRARAGRALGRLDGAVERDPRQHLRVREVAARPAHLPDALVGLVPGALEELEQRCAATTTRDRRGSRPCTRAWEHVHHSPYTSSWNCSCAALPMRTGREPA